MELFPDIHVSEALVPHLVVTTPLGIVGSTATIDQTQLLLENAGATYRLPADGAAARWMLPQCLAEVISCRPALFANYWNQITDCWAFLWRMQVYEALSQVRFSAQFMPSAASIDGGSNSGEHLDAQTWDDGTTELSLGTADGQALLYRAKADEWFPKRYAAQAMDWDILPVVDYVPYGLRVHIKDVAPGDRFQIHFAVAWALFDPESVGTWLAVDLTDQQIIAGARGHYSWDASR
jgi:hypothetical protein